MEYASASPTGEKSDGKMPAKRSGRACDRCRKYRNKCIRTLETESCEGCKAAGIECTFEDPNFKRGPPKGYIQAIEHRLKLVETVLGAIVASDDSSAKKVVTNLNKDHLAYDVLDRVHNGPYGAPAAEEAANESPTSSISTRVRHTGPGTSRPAREPRTERELMSLTQDEHNVPPNWQNILINNLGHSSETAWAGGDYGHDEVIARQARFSRDAYRTTSLDAAPEMNQGSSELSFLNSVVNSNIMGQSSTGRDWQVPDRLNLHHPNSPADLIGSEGIWPEVQKHLLDLYFNHIHPLFPMVKMSTFNDPLFSSTHKAQNEFLMLSMYAAASLYADHAKTRDAGVMYFSSAKQLLGVQAPSVTACQALILLAYCEVATGTFEQAWVYLGMAVHMAKVLGINRKAAPGSLTVVEEEEHNYTWWSCVIIDKLLASSLGFRPAALAADADIDSPRLVSQRPPMAEAESRQLEHEHITAYLGEITSLSSIMGDILEELYSEKASGSEDTHRNDFQVRLLEWREKLREDLRCDIYPGSPTPRAQVLTMHLSYWSAVIVNNRSLYVDRDLWSRMEDRVSNLRQHAGATGQATLEMLRTAPDQILQITAIFRRAHGFRATSPFISSILMAAGASFLAYPSYNVSKFEEIVLYLKELEGIWPGSMGKWRSLVNAKAKLDESTSAMEPLSGPLKRRGMPSRIETPGPSGQSSKRQAMSYGPGHSGQPLHLNTLSGGPSPVPQMLDMARPGSGLNLPSHYLPRSSGQGFSTGSSFGGSEASSSGLRSDPRSHTAGLTPARWQPSQQPSLYGGQGALESHGIPGLNAAQGSFIPGQEGALGAPSQYDLMFPGASQPPNQGKPRSRPN